MFADLHIHSFYSDGTNTPKELVALAKENNVSAIAIADHDTIDGVSELLIEAKRCDILAIPATEISTSIAGVRIHVLGYNIDCKNEVLQKFFKEISMARTENTKKILDKLNKLGLLGYSWDDVLKHNTGKSWICSSHVYEAMKKDGKYQNWKEWPQFYERYFSKDSVAYIDIDGFTAQNAIDVIRIAGGIPVVAHPKLIGDDSQVEKLVGMGLQGIEVYYPAHNDQDVKRYTNIAKKYDLIITGGTDWHGELTKWKVLIGESGLGQKEYEKFSENLFFK